VDLTQDKYINILIEIKRRTAVIDAIYSKEINSLYEATTIETAYLQLRKMLELIAFSSLIANINVYSKQYNKFATHYNAHLMFKDMKRVNADFYPKPIIQTPSQNPDYVSEWSAPANGYLTKDDFLELYEQCGRMMHAENPYGAKIDYDKYLEQLPIWRAKIVCLLNAHTITLLNDSNVYLFQMGDINSNPSYNVFGLIKSQTIKS
jgi:hypothetical protein